MPLLPHVFSRIIYKPVEKIHYLCTCCSKVKRPSPFVGKRNKPGKNLGPNFRDQDFPQENRV